MVSAKVETFVIIYAKQFKSEPYKHFTEAIKNINLTYMQSSLCF